MPNPMPKPRWLSSASKVTKYSRKTKQPDGWKVVADRAEIEKAHPDWTDAQVSDEMQRLTLESVLGPDYKKDAE